MADESNGDTCDGEECDVDEPSDDWSKDINYGEVVASVPLQCKDFALSGAFMLVVIGIVYYTYRTKGESRLWARAETFVVMIYGLACYFVPEAMYQNFVSANRLYVAFVMGSDNI